MKEITVFYLEHCPYCIKAKKAFAELSSEMPEMSGIGIRWIEESREPAVAEQYDYYYVPTIYAGERKLYEANPSQDYDAIKVCIRAALEEALKL